jgi:hypothetical protein
MEFRFKSHDHSKPLLDFYLLLHFRGNVKTRGSCLIDTPNRPDTLKVGIKDFCNCTHRSAGDNFVR